MGEFIEMRWEMNSKVARLNCAPLEATISGQT